MSSSGGTAGEVVSLALVGCSVARRSNAGFCEDKGERVAVCALEDSPLSSFRTLLVALVASRAAVECILRLSRFEAASQTTHERCRRVQHAAHNRPRHVRDGDEGQDDVCGADAQA